MPNTQLEKKPATSKSGNGSKDKVYSVPIAGIQVVSAPEKVRTVLGSCIGIAIYDRVAKIGGLAHVILPCSKEGSGDPKKFADTAVDLLVEQIIDAGGKKKRLTAKISGGASMFGLNASNGLGKRNEDCVKERLTSHAIRLAASETGGTKGRKMSLDPATGDVQVEIIGQSPQII